MSRSRPTGRAASLHHRFLLAVGVGGALAIALLAWGASVALDGVVARQGDARVADAARRGVLVVDAALAERVRESEAIAASPEVIGAARAGAARAQALGIVHTPIPVLEKRFIEQRSLQVDLATLYYLRAMLRRIGAADIMLTDAYGFNAVTTGLSSDFVQSDEEWWQTTWRDGLSHADAAYDSAAHQPVVSLAAIVRSDTTPVGVIKLKYSMAPLTHALGEAGTGIDIDVLDANDRVVLSSDSTVLGSLAKGLAPSSLGTPGTVSPSGVTERAVAVLASGGRWRVTAHLPLGALEAPFAATRRGLAYGIGALVLVLALLLLALHYFLARRMSEPTTELAEAAEAVAAGDFSVELRRVSANDEIGRLGRGMAAMILELRRLAGAIAGAAAGTTQMSHEITAGSEEMAAAAGEMAHTASELSVQASGMAGTIGTLARSAAELKGLATALDEGAHQGVERNTVLRTLAAENRAGLDASAASLGTLASDVNASASAVEALGEASHEIRSFVTLVRKLARQSKLLALNAAMEAARAGEHGEGFAVVASEVRRLASMSSEAAERTESIVSGVLSGIDQSRESAKRAVNTAEEVRSATARASASFVEIERAVADAEAWTSAVEQTSATTNRLIAEMTERLDSLAAGTDSFAAAMEQVAASSEQQSASTQEIAAAAASLSSAAERLAQLVANFRLGDAAPAPVAAALPPDAAPPTPPVVAPGVPSLSVVAELDSRPVPA
ncbi:MAG: methyl-accepting chemotaxis protein [Gemmatimonadaceae bacterium]|nr:methyl-accepting chemotaxis protein [Gemmatimonadaceae bacterium]